MVNLENHVVISQSRGDSPKSRGDCCESKSRGDLHSEVIFIKEINKNSHRFKNQTFV